MSDTMQQVYLLAQEHCGLKVGDWVRVIRKAENYEAGWGNVWAVDMISAIGAIGKVEYLNEYGVGVYFPTPIINTWTLPYFVLEKVEKPAHKFKPFDKVLMRDEDSDVWIPTLFGWYATTGDYCKTHPYVQIGQGSFKQCIPYEGNEHLVGTTGEPNG